MSQRILSMVRILIFVNHDITEAITVFLKNIFTALQEFNRYHQQIIEVERIILAEFFLIIFVYVSHFLTVKITSFHAKFVGHQESVLGIGNSTKHSSRRKVFIIQIQALQRPLNNGL